MLDHPAPQFTASSRAPAPSRRRAWVWPLVVLALLAAGGVAAWQLLPNRPTTAPPTAASAEPPPALAVAVVTAQSRPLARAVLGDGSVVAWQELVLGAEAGGLRVAEVAVEEGDHVRQGQVLVRLEDSVPAAQLAQAEAGLAEAEAALSIARADLNRAVELSRSQNTPRQVLEQRQSAARQAEARIASARAARDEARARLSQTRIEAPYDGVVLRRNVLPGAVTGVGQEMVRLLRDGRLELDARVPELDLGAVAPGQPVKVWHGTREIAATVRAVAPNVTPDNRLGTVHVALPADSGLRPGMFARAEIHAEASPGIVVPQEAVVFRDGAAGAFVLEGQQVRLRRLTTGTRRDGMVEVLDGLAAGERVVRTGAGFLADGDHVRLAPAAE
ncbi:efflux RND transporter periplasmic adaptor subunit [Pseudoroseomonas wenyumeiae]|uniref:Efflux RND transporter periplasmic adaptor subunit n=1 Tax=Teichococcus wenyumeiae TaxID=2478470 RepID=A0A3A9JV85_9PROT|nr:efflux RND transporter periplasmic adaptor subunit [Pseudoroseomonas wenyumeiae]RKK04708.1 efflux RND transporter periplasmic adaptor subunit [Pseudoroseomonas wenyumeiae]RMI20645.1 efflux RND transporter periplasmic adaptor subunit [Pseudoroseomonas wenyumeiae]